MARLLSGGSGYCTGWLASSENHLITNDHCIGSASEALNTDYEFMAEDPNCRGENGEPVYRSDIYSGANYIQGDSNLDYCLVQIVSGDPAPIHGYLEIDNRTAIVGEEIYIIGHPGGRLKEMTIYSTHPNDPTGIPVVYSITEPPCTGSGYYDVGYFADTEGGSSGSPVLARSSHKVIALHHCANCPNRGVPIDLVYAEIGDYLTPGPAGIVELNKEKYGCDDTVAIEVRDGDLLGQGSQNVVVTTTGGDSETVTLTETGPTSGIFQGTIPTATGTVVTEDGTLQIADSETITVTYIDLDDGQGNYNVVVTDTATIDCVPPQILNVQTTDVQPRSAVVTITANEPVRGIVYHGLSCGSLTETALGSGYATAATVNVTGLQDNTTYFYAVEAVDEGENSVSDDNGGACYTFTTPEVPDFFTEQNPGDLDGLTLFFV
ncbi:MAG: trypsin-like peptidase domain-containing protein, partial [Phycisphaerae bacterium]|nr:trypsin-like peptidase domain-containing protein [Phycisphaerae bacterium]